ncbi:MAG TPA: pyruvate dehydrogenase complex dihydrolipoamide acetyltransferase [Kofleriaceae bacterium]|nr:pyruvate dehydrogenase complex dihydrolipoamide acetyltransferase [Kofleriaceae bacterium]
MAQIIGLPKLSPTMEEGVLVRWTKKEGDKVSPGDLVAEVETDKANMDFNIEDEGVLLKLLVKEGDTVKLGAPVAIIGKSGEDVGALVEKARAQSAAPAAAPAPAPREATRPEQDQRGTSQARPAAAPNAALRGEAQPAQPAGGRLLASPLAKSLAIELGIDLRQITGTGPGGRIVERDVRAAADGHARPSPHNGAEEEPEAQGAEAAEAAETSEAAEARAAGPAPAESRAIAVRTPAPLRSVPDAEDDWEDLPASNMRKRIASRLTEAKRDVPHFYLMRDLDAAPLLAYRQRLNDLLTDPSRGEAKAGTKISVNDLVVKAVALALRRMPECNASWEGEAIRRFHRVHVGVAVAIPDGLVTPVVRDTDTKGIGAIAAEVKDLADRAKRRALKAHEITGSTFSVSNLGMFGIERFTAIINPPEAGILAVGAVRDVPVVAGDKLVPGKRMTVTMSCDHRVIDGATGARWLQIVAELIEKPELLAL